MFDDIIGQEKIKKYFKSAIEGKRLSQAYLFYGLEGTGKDAVAFEIAKCVNCKSRDNVPCGTCKSCIIPLL